MINKKIFLFISIIFTFIFSFNFYAQSDEKITVTTYYPSPFGVYKELRAKRMAIGDNYYDASQYCWSGTCTSTIDSNADLVVEGNVGIGTASPTQKLDVDGYVKGRSGLCIGDDCRNSWPKGCRIKVNSGRRDGVTSSTTNYAENGNGWQCTDWITIFGTDHKSGIQVCIQCR